MGRARPIRWSFLLIIALMLSLALAAPTRKPAKNGSSSNSALNTPSSSPAAAATKPLSKPNFSSSSGYYEILGVAEDCDHAAIRKAFKSHLLV